MNERIKELADEAGVSITAADKNGVFTLLPDNQKKFAELLLKECGEYLMRPEFIGRSDLDWSMVLNEHFGVEE